MFIHRKCAPCLSKRTVVKKKTFQLLLERFNIEAQIRMAIQTLNNADCRQQTTKINANPGMITKTK